MRAPKDNYFLPLEYATNPEPSEGQFTDTWETSKTYQYAVYHKFLKSLSPDSRVLDLGCGYGWKLRYYVSEVTEDITGVDLSEPISYCLNTHPIGEWRVLDFECFDPPNWGKFDAIICADVIEHLVNPDELLRYIHHFSRPDTRIMISTPDRVQVRGKYHIGPPPNPYHIREWAYAEFLNYLISRDFRIVSTGFLPSHMFASNRSNQYASVRSMKEAI